MGFYRKKPVVIEAVRLPKLGEDASDELAEWLEQIPRWESGRSGDLLIHTLEGVMIASPGDWIIKGVNGEFYPCKPDVFDKTYEPVSDNNMTREPKGYLRNCFISQLDSDSGPLFSRNENGLMVAYLDGYAIVPRERYEGLERQIADIHIMLRRVLKNGANKPIDNTLDLSARQLLEKQSGMGSPLRTGGSDE